MIIICIVLMSYALDRNKIYLCNGIINFIIFINYNVMYDHFYQINGFNDFLLKICPIKSYYNCELLLMYYTICSLRVILFCFIRTIFS